jgi:hypothetical protein
MGQSCNVHHMTHATLQVTDYDANGRPEGDDLAVLSVPLSEVLTQELDGASAALAVGADDLLLAALGGAIARTIGQGFVAVDVPGHGRTVSPVSLPCGGPQATDATDALAGVHRSLAAVSLHRSVRVVPDPHDQPLSDILFAYGTSGSARLGHLLELHAYRRSEVLVLDWWYDTRSFEPYTIEELSEQLPYALIELTSEAAPPVLAAAELAMAY